MRKPRTFQALEEYRSITRLIQNEKPLFKRTQHDELSVALIFPNQYHLGISNLGFHRVFQLANLTEGIHCQRFFWDKAFRKYYSFDHLRPIDEFPVWAFSICFEMDYFNMLQILKIQGIPLLAKDRNKNHPLVIAGGMVTYFNAKPLEPICDMIYHGDAEPHFSSLLSILKAQMSHHRSREATLAEVSSIKSVSVPAHGKKATEISCDTNIAQDSAHSLFIHPKASLGYKHLLELGRGCLHRCAFCVSGHARQPARFLSLEKALSKMRALIAQSNHRDFGLIAATPTDYPWLDTLLDEMEKEDIRFSLSSLRLDRLTPSLLQGLIRSGQRSITIAPEGGSQKMRDLFQKGIQLSEIELAFSMIAKSGIREIKMYGIFGLEEETESDLLGFSNLSHIAGKHGIEKILWSFNPLIPKPGTPFFSRQFQDAKTLREKHAIIKQSMKGITCAQFESIRDAQLQYQLANGDESSLIAFSMV